MTWSSVYMPFSGHVAGDNNNHHYYYSSILYCDATELTAHFSYGVPFPPANQPAQRSSCDTPQARQLPARCCWRVIARRHLDLLELGQLTSGTPTRPIYSSGSRRTGSSRLLT